MKYFFIVLMVGSLICLSTARAQFDFFQSVFEPPTTQDQEEENDFPLDLIWITNTFVPDDYHGKALPTPGSSLFLMALTPTQNPTGLDFEWNVEDSSSQVRGGLYSGRGKNTFAFSTESILPVFRHRVRVQVNNPTTSQSATRFIDISLQKPRAVLFRHHQGAYVPLGATFPLGVGQSAEIISKPFYFNVETIRELSFGWFFDGRKIESEETDNALSITISPGTPREIKKAIENSIINTNRPGTLPETAHTQGALIIQ